MCLTSSVCPFPSTSHPFLPSLPKGWPLCIASMGSGVLLIQLGFGQWTVLATPKNGEGEKSEIRIFILSLWVLFIPTIHPLSSHRPFFSKGSFHYWTTSFQVWEPFSTLGPWPRGHVTSLLLASGAYPLWLLYALAFEICPFANKPFGNIYFECASIFSWDLIDIINT